MSSKKLSLQTEKDLKHLSYAWVIACIIAALHYVSFYQDCTTGLKTVGNLACFLSQEGLGLRTFKLFFMAWASGILSIAIFKLSQGTKGGIKTIYLFVSACLMLFVLSVDIQVGHPGNYDKTEVSEFVLTE